MTRDDFKAFGKSEWSRKERKESGRAARLALKRELPALARAGGEDDLETLRGEVELERRETELGWLEAEAPCCPTCGGPGGYLGTIGNATWFRCRDCGSDFGRE